MQPHRMNRRQFLTKSLVVTGGSVVLCSGLATAGLYAPPVEFPAEVADGVGAKKVLVAYASKCGSTAQIAQEITRVLTERGSRVDLLRAADVQDLSGYQTVVLGSAIRMRKWLPEAKEFVTRFQPELAEKSTAFFTACLSMSEDTPKTVRKWMDFSSLFTKSSGLILKNTLPESWITAG